MPEPFRVAVYYAPERDDPLWERGCAWLGRDPETGEAVAQSGGPAHLTVSPRRYGFHATLKPPMHLTGGIAAFLKDVGRLAAALTAFWMPALEVRQIGRFTALCLAGSSTDFRNFADACVVRLDAHRRPEDAAARAARGIGRSAREVRNIERFGYPLLFEDWRFHMTLSDANDDAPLQARAEKYFETVLRQPRKVASLCVFQEASKGADFMLTHRLRLGA